MSWSREKLQVSGYKKEKQVEILTAKYVQWWNNLLKRRVWGPFTLKLKVKIKSKLNWQEGGLVTVSSSVNLMS